MNFARDNAMLIFAALATLAALTVVLTGHATDGASLLAVLFTVIGGAGGGHIASQGGAQGNVIGASSPAIQPTESSR